MSATRVKAVAAAAVIAAGAYGVATLPMASAADDPTATKAGGANSYVVVAKDPASLPAAKAAVTSAGGTVTSEDGELGILTATGPSVDFATKTDVSAAVLGVARNRRIGSNPKRDQVMDDVRAVKSAPGAPQPARKPAPKPAPRAEPLADLQWDMAMIGATPTGSYAKQQGSAAVRVGIIDTGVDGTHPDIKPNFSASLSRNFVTDIPEVDGPCEHAGCVDPVDEDDDGHGTHVAGTIGSPINGIGIAGVAPKVSLVNVRAGQDSGYFFLEPTIKALRYSGDAGIDVVNMSFYVDPWLFNCTANPADNPAEQAEQRAIIEATQRALGYAHRKGVTLVSAIGNEHTDLGKPGADATSPDYPENTAHPRTIDNATCLNLPAEGKNVISVSAIGPSGKKADYSNHGLEQNDVSAPGGYFRDFAGDPAKYRQPGNLILAPMPRNVALASGSVDPTTGESLNEVVIASCSAAGPANCAYWQYLQGTSMASPHAAGVAALIVAWYGHRNSTGATLSPATVERVLKASATNTACPAPVITYVIERPGDATYDAPCVGTANRNSIYGDGVVNALRAVGGRA